MAHHAEVLANGANHFVGLVYKLTRWRKENSLALALRQVNALQGSNDQSCGLASTRLGLRTDEVSAR